MREAPSDILTCSTAICTGRIPRDHRPASAGSATRLSRAEPIGFFALERGVHSLTQTIAPTARTLPGLRRMVLR